MKSCQNLGVRKRARPVMSACGGWLAGWCLVSSRSSGPEEAESTREEVSSALSWGWPSA